MSLVGNLEDLGLGDILQIVSLSRKSGELVLQSQNREGRIIFKNGQVNRAVSTVFRENLGDLLVRRGIVGINVIKNAAELQRTVCPNQRLGAILTEKHGVSKETIDSLVKEQIEQIVYSFFSWNEGTFVFDLGDSGEIAATSFDPLQFMLDQGLNPQWLAMEGSRIFDERRHRGESLDIVGDEPIHDVASLFAPVDEVAPDQDIRTDQEVPSQNSLTPLIFVDDDDVIRRRLGAELCTRGFRVIACATATEFLCAVEDECNRGGDPFLLVDLLMPRQDGSGILGGLELIERLRIEYPGLSALVMSDHSTDEAQQRISLLGLPNILKKPDKTSIRSDSGLSQIQVLAEEIKDSFATCRSCVLPDQQGTFNLGAELRFELGESPEPRGSRVPETPGLYLLRGMLQELNNPALGGGIILLVLRFASELMNRAVIFLVKEDEIVGLGQFGMAAIGGISADERVRRMRIPRNEGSVFEQVLNSWSPLKTVTGTGKWDKYLVEDLGGGLASEIFLGPIISEGKVVAILFGDNAPQKKVIGDTESLEIFLSQAGLSMEKALLERRLRSKETLV